MEDMPEGTESGLPAGWKRTYNDIHPHDVQTALELMREMAEALEFYNECNTVSKGYDHGTLANEVLKKFREWK